MWLRHTDIATLWGRCGLNWQCSPKAVIVGSYSWTKAGAYDNHENTLIIHERELARACCAAWQRLWATVTVKRVCNAFGVYLPMVMREYAVL